MAIKFKDSGTILRVAIYSRIVLLSLIILWRSLFSPYDTSASINPNCLSPNSSTPKIPILFPKIATAIEDSIVWDSDYFVRISQCGYEYEQTYAFLPLLPISMSLFSKTVFAPLVPLIGHRAVLGLSGYVLTNVAFVIAAVYMYRLSVIILKDTDAALRASILFCFNPASIFYSSIYSESLYALLSIAGIYHLVSGASNYAMLLLALSGSARSNGALNAGYFCFQSLHRAYEAFNARKHPAVVIWILSAGLLRSLFIFAPFIAFQAYGYYNMCLGRASNEMRPWCKYKIPSLGVGFLRYFQLKQLPNFLLASPILSLALCSIVHYMKLRPTIFFSLGFRASNEEKHSAYVLFSLTQDLKPNTKKQDEKSVSKRLQGDGTLRQRKQNVKGDNLAFPSKNEFSLPGYLSIIVLPFVLHLGFMAATAFFIMHVQVSTRFLSASPPLYWFASYVMISPAFGKKWGYLIWAYSTGYILLGSLLFSNFYPFT
ncbi:GPI mannosyltransferase 2 [Dillenia turbinata]|uniref:GPI mannosyltransferase 2 n=1 Tax=Dillenia turbinata TaxID=194707 RepID=A0AAN8VVW5_9MAGN